MTNTPEHRAEAQSRLSRPGQKFFPMVEYDDQEELVLEIRKHPFGLVIIEFLGIFVAVFIMACAFGLSYLFDSSSIGVASSSWRAAILGSGFVLAALTITIMLIALIIYRNNLIFVTTEKLAQVQYRNLISRKISQLSIGDVQDITVHQNGIFSRIFNYGTLVVETSGEQQNYTFTFVPDPYKTASAIIGAHEENLRLYGN